MKRNKKTRPPVWRMAWQHVTQTVHDQLAGLLSRETLADRVAAHGGGHRSRVYPPLTTLGLFVEQALGFDATCQAAASRALSARTARGQTPNSLSTGPYSKARQRPPWMAHSTYARLPDHLTIREERIICHVLPSRPDRVEPRANKRRPKQQRYLNQPRDIARQALQEA